MGAGAATSGACFRRSTMAGDSFSSYGLEGRCMLDREERQAIERSVNIVTQSIVVDAPDQNV